MDNKTRLINEYKHLVRPGNKKSIPELCDMLERNMSAVRIDFELINDITRKMILISIDNYIRINKKELSLNDLKFIAYKVPRDGAGAAYYDYSHVPVKADGNDDSIYIIFEKHLSDYIYCNCNKLFLDLTIKRGISIHDYENNTMRLIEYLSRIEADEKQWY